MQYSSTHPWRLWAPLLCAVWLAACGGGGGGGGTGNPGGPTPGEISVYAGSLQEKGAADGTGSAAQFNEPVDVALDAQGNAYIADRLNHSIRKVTPQGVVTTLAGTPGVPGATDGAAAQAMFSSPSGVAVTAQGDVYVADTGNHVIRKIAPNGAVTTVAGAVGQTGSVDGPGAAARFLGPHDLALDAQGNLYIADRSHTVRRMRPDGTVTTFAGAPGVNGSVVGDGPQARFGDVVGVAVDGAGVVYVAETLGSASNGQVRRFDADAHALPWGTLADGLVRAEGVADIAAAGAGEVVILASAVVPFAPSFAAIYNSVRRITPGGTVVTVAGRDNLGSFGHEDAAGTAARFNAPQGLALGTNARIVVADTGNHAVRTIDAQAQVTTLAGGIGAGSANGPRLAARFFNPFDIEALADGTLLVNELAYSTIRRIGPAGDVTTLALGAPLTDARFGFSLTAARDGTLWVRSSPCVSCSFLYTVPPGGTPTFVADVFNLRAMTPAPGGGIYFVNETELVRLAADGTRAVMAGGLATPQDVVTGPDGTIYVAELNGHTVRAIDASGASRVVAGSPGQAGAADGPAAVSRLNMPRALAADEAGNVYVADATTLRRISPDGQVGSIAGSASQVLAGSPLVRAAARVKRMAWHGGFLYATVDNAVLRIAVPN
jgi:sugar lactone lactonase YvrE